MSNSQKIQLAIVLALLLYGIFLGGGGHDWDSIGE